MAKAKSAAKKKTRGNKKLIEDKKNFYVQPDVRGVGRPSKYNDEILTMAHNYMRRLPIDEVIHTIEGLADYLDITRETIYDWCKDEAKADFSDIVRKIMSKQGKTLMNKGLTGVFNAPIVKVMASKHGYRDAMEQTGKDGGAIEVEVHDKKQIADALKDVL